MSSVRILKLATETGHLKLIFMNKNFLWKLGLIVGTLLFFLFGIFGIPKSFSGEGLLAAMTDHIHLGLDLRGGTHLILQVQVNDAVNVDAQNAIEVSEGTAAQPQDRLHRHHAARPAEQSRPHCAEGRAAGARALTC